MKLDKKKTRQVIWLLIFTKTKEENRANANLIKQGFNTFLPLITLTNRNGKNKSLVPIFPRYLFVQINLDLSNWTSIKSTPGVSKIVMFSDKFTSIPDELIKSIKARLNKEGIYKEEISRVKFQKGDNVTIKEGPFAGLNAIFLSTKSKDRVNLLLNLLNTTVNAELSKFDIEQKEIIKTFKF